MENASLMGRHREKFPDNKFRSIDEKYYLWKIYKNPYNHGMIYLETRDGVVVGSSTASTKKIAILDEVFLASELGDSFTLSEYRKQGINTKALTYCTEYAIKKGINIIYGGPATQANYRLLLKVGLLSCESIKYTFMTKGLQPTLFTLKLIAKLCMFRDALKNRDYLKFLINHILTQRVELKRYKNQKYFHVSTIEKFDHEIDGFWGKPRYSFCIFRDSSYLNWRYFENPDRYTVLAAIENSEYLGYIALKMSKDKSIGVICDYISVDDRPVVFSNLITEAEKILKAEGAKLIQVECIVGTPYYQTLKDLGYYDHGPDSYQLLTIYSKTELGKRILRNPGKWHFTAGDWDGV